MRKLIVYLAVGGCICTSSLAGEWEDLVAALPDMTSEPITNGFYFWEGEYIPPPYTVTRKGVDIYINGHLQTTFAYCPFQKQTGEKRSVEVLPSVPTNITESTEPLSGASFDYCADVYSYYHGQGLTGMELVSNVAVAVAQLPNVGEVLEYGETVIRFKTKLTGEGRFFSFTSDSEKQERERLANLYRNGGLDVRGREEFNHVVASMQEDGCLYGSQTTMWGQSLSYAREDFEYLLPLIDEGASDEKIKANNKDRYETEIVNPRRLDMLLKHRDSLMSEEFRRRLFGEYWQTYGVKPETEEERIERIFRDVSYYQRTTDDLLMRLDGMVYNITVRHHGDTNKFTEADIDEIDHSRRRYEESLVERDAYWAALSETDKALMTVKLAQKKADEEAEKKNKVLEKKRSSRDTRVTKYENMFFEKISADPFCASWESDRIRKTAHTKACAVHVIKMALGYPRWNNEGNKRIPVSLNELIAGSDGETPILVDGIESAKDAWGKVFGYALGGAREDSIVVVSAGPDGVFGSSDDIKTTEDDL